MAGSVGAGRLEGGRRANALRPGENTIELHCTNTLAPYFEATTQTGHAYPFQLASGVYGPVALLG